MLSKEEVFYLKTCHNYNLLIVKSKKSFCFLSSSLSLNMAHPDTPTTNCCHPIIYTKTSPNPNIIPPNLSNAIVVNTSTEKNKPRHLFWPTPFAVTHCTKFQQCMMVSIIQVTWMGLLGLIHNIGLTFLQWNFITFWLVSALQGDGGIL